MKPLLLATAAIALVATGAVAQEKCYKDGKDRLVSWAQENGRPLNDLAAQMEQARKEGKDPNTLMIKYQGMEMPLSAAYLIEHQKYDAKTKVEIDATVGDIRDCAKGVALPRGAYDLIREFTGLTTLLPERATRVDFEEIRQGNILGGDDAFIPKGLEDARKTVEKAGRDINREFNKGLENLGIKF
jgi:hypothetical protein